MGSVQFRFKVVFRIFVLMIFSAALHRRRPPRCDSELIKIINKQKRRSCVEGKMGEKKVLMENFLCEWL